MSKGSGQKHYRLFSYKTTHTLAHTSEVLQIAVRMYPSAMCYGELQQTHCVGSVSNSLPLPHPGSSQSETSGAQHSCWKSCKCNQDKKDIRPLRGTSYSHIPSPWPLQLPNISPLALQDKMLLFKALPTPRPLRCLSCQTTPCFM